MVLTMDMMMASFSRPWNPSTELTSMADSDWGRCSFSKCTCRAATQSSQTGSHHSLPASLSLCAATMQHAAAFWGPDLIWGEIGED